MLYHFCTNGLRKGLVFSSDKDYIYGMNSIALCKIKFQDVKVMAFCLMNNHVHFILDCEEKDGIMFLKHYKSLVGAYLKRTYGNERNLAGADIGYKAMTSPDYIVKAIAYVLRNPLSAGVQVIPSEYRWSSAQLYFGSRAFCQAGQIRISGLSQTRIKVLTKSHCSFPPEWHIDVNGMIFPGDYTDYKAVEAIYGRPSQLMYHILKNSDAEIEADTGVLTKCRYSDEELCASRDYIIHDTFHKASLSSMSIEEKITLASMMRSRYHASWPTLSRITGLDRDLLKLMK